MDRTIVPDSSRRSISVKALLGRLSEEMETMSPQLRKAAAFALDHPFDIGFASVRDLAAAAGVKPNTLVRLARAVGFDGFDEFRAPFRDQLRSRANLFPDRAQWLQGLSTEGRLGSLFAEIVGTSLDNVEQMFTGITAGLIHEIADAIEASRRTYVIGVGANFALAHNFAYLVGMAVENVVAVPHEGNVPMDDIVRAGPADVVIALSFEPYRSEVVEATGAARSQGAAVAAVTDSHGSPIAVGADYVIVAPSATPQFFPSTLAAAAVLETLASFIVADAGQDVVSAIERFHRRRYDLGVYWRDGS